MNQSKSLFIVGINGFLGQQLRLYFSDLGWQVWGSTSRPEKTREIFFDFNVPQKFDPPQNVSVVIYCSFLISDGFGQAQRDNNFFALKILREEIFPASAHHIFISSLSAASGATHYGKSKKVCESIFEGDLIIRPGLIVGNGGLYQVLKKQIGALPVFPLVASGSQVVFTIQLEELLDFIWKCITEKTKGSFFAFSSENLTFKEMCLKIRGTKRIPFFLPIPLLPLLCILRVLSLARINKAHFFLERLQGLNENAVLAKTKENVENVFLAGPIKHW